MLRHENISFPLNGLNKTSRLAWAKENDSVREVLWNILLTRPGERIMRPEFGAGIGEFIHQPNNETTRRLIADIAEQAIKRWEPRIDLLELTVTTEPAQIHQVSLNVRYRLKLNGQQDTLTVGLSLQS